MRHTDDVVISECLSGYTAMAFFSGEVVVFAMVNYRNTLIESYSRV